MTYAELLEVLLRMTPEHLQDNITVENTAENECYPASISFAGENHNSLEKNHLIICF